MAKDVAGTVDPRALAVPHAEHAVVFALAQQFSLLAPPHRGGRKLLIQARAEDDVVGLQEFGGTLKLHVEPAERGAAIASDVARGVEPGAAVALLLHQAEAD